MHECLNLIAEPEGYPGCVLIRALEPVAGLDLMRQRRGQSAARALCSGPGKLTQAMAITRALNGADVTGGPLAVHRGAGEEFEVRVTTRVGITQCAEWPLRFLVRGNPFISRA